MGGVFAGALVCTTVRVISGVHNDTTDARALTEVTVTTGFTDFDVLVLFVTDNTKAGRTHLINKTDFT